MSKNKNKNINKNINKSMSKTMDNQHEQEHQLEHESEQRPEHTKIRERSGAGTCGGAGVVPESSKPEPSPPPEKGGRGR